MIVGVDFDNTIVCYDDLFHRIGVERGLVPSVLPQRKNEVRDFLRRHGQEKEWTELQGHVYGARMGEAQPFPVVIEFFARAAPPRLPVYIISHKTPAAVGGPAYDLHQTARGWLAEQGFFDAAKVGQTASQVYYGATRGEKILH